MLRNIAAVSLLLSVMVVVGGCQDSPESAQNSPKSAQNSPKAVQNSPETVQDSPESVMEDGLDCMEKMVEILGTIKDKETAEAATDDIKALAEDTEKIKERMTAVHDEFKAMSKQEQMELKDKFKERAKKVMTGLMGEMLRLSSIPEAKQAMADMQKALDKMED